MRVCTDWTIMQAISLHLVITLVDVILLARGGYQTCIRACPYRAHALSLLVHALYQNRTLLGVLLILLCVTNIYMVFVLTLVVRKLSFTETCFVTSAPVLFVSYWYVSQKWVDLISTKTCSTR